jgi:hypothetical protein
MQGPFAVGQLLGALWEVDADEQATALAARAIRHVALDDPVAVAELLDNLRTYEQAAALAARLPTSVHFNTFKIGHPGERFKFGREPDGSAADAWTWEDLE